MTTQHVTIPKPQHHVALRPQLPPLPPRMQSLPVDERGYPVPWFVTYIDGKPDFRVMDAAKRIRAARKHLCWICGQALGSRFVFVAGPMCGCNRISAEPPSHKDCAEFAARACPFLVLPKMVRNEHDLPEGYQNPGGTMIERNPGVAMLWFTRTYQLVSAPPSFLFGMGDPFEVAWYKEGRAATRAEVLEAIESGLPFLEEAIRTERPETEWAEAQELLAQECEALLRFIPA